MVRIINIDTKNKTIRVSNGKDDLEWFTTDTGSHVPLKKGQSKAEAIKEHFGGKNPSDTWTNKKAKLHLDFKAGRITQKQLEDGLNKLAIGPSVKDKEAVTKDRKEREKVVKEQIQEEADFQAQKKQQPAKKVKETYADTSEIDGAEVFKDGDDYVVLYANGTKTREFSSKTEADKFAKSLSKQPTKPDTSNADYFKSTMQETMKKFPRLYEHEQKHLEEYAVSAFSALRNNPGKEKAIVDEILDSYNQHVKRLGMWVDTPTLAKKAFVEKLAEAYK